MMTVALITVILWSISGFGDDIFPSVPGMGAAFITHFIMNQLVVIINNHIRNIGNILLKFSMMICISRIISNMVLE